MAENSQFTDIWNNAYLLYKEKTGRDILKDKALTELKTTEDLLARIESQNFKFRDFNDKRKKLRSALKATMHPVEVLSLIAKSAVQNFGPASAIFVAINYLIVAAGGVSEAYSSITDLLERLADFSDRLEEYSHNAMDDKLKKRVIQILATLLEIFAESEILMASNRLKEFGRVIWLGKDDRVEGVMKRLETLVTSEKNIVAAKTFSTTVRVEKEVGILTSLQLDAKKERAAESNFKLLHTALVSEAFIKVSEIQARILSERQEGSGKWLRSEKLFVAWLKGDIATLFILGGPGSGKSFLAGSAISHLLATYSFQKGFQRASIGYFYIHEDDEQLRTINTILKVVAFQLQERNPVYTNYLVKVCGNFQKTITAADTWKNLFLDFFNAPVSQYGDNFAFIVLDGLDEAPLKEREVLFKLLKSLDNTSPGNSLPRIRVLIVGRPDLRDDTVFIWDKPVVSIEVSAVKTKQDIVNYIKSNVGRVRALNQTRESLERRKQLRKDIIQKLSDGANGMFLWVNLMFDQINDMSRPSQVAEALHMAPQSLSKMIHNTFQRLAAELKGFRKEDFNEILSWVTYAQRPLYLKELDAILKLTPPLGEGVPDLEKRLRDQFASFFTLKRKDGLTTANLVDLAATPSYQLSLTPSEAVIDASSRIPGWKSDESDDDSSELDDDSFSGDELSSAKNDPYNSSFSSTTIALSHASIRDYLVRQSNPATREYTSDLEIGLRSGHTENHIALTCIRVLTNDLKLPHRDSDSESSNSSENESSDESSDEGGKFPDGYVCDLANYAADFFINHLKRTNRLSLISDEQTIITQSLLKLFTEINSIKNWIQASTDLDDFGRDWIGSGKHGEWVRGYFLSQVASNHNYSDKEKDEMKKLSESDYVLLKPIAIECGKQWLTNDGTDNPGNFVAFLDYFVPVSGNSVRFKGNRVDTDISEARLQELADFADINKISQWHSNFGESMRLEDHFDTAIHHLKLAIELDHRNWVAMGRLSFCYEERELWELAIGWAGKALENCPRRYKSEQSEYWRTISLCHLEIFNYVEAKNAAKEACLLLPEDGSSLATYILALDAVRNYEELINYVEVLQEKTAKDGEENLLTMALLANDSLHEILGHAGREVGKVQLIIQAVFTASESALRNENQEEYAIQLLELGKLYYTQNQDDKRAIECWEMVVKNEEADDETSQSASDCLAELFYQKAVTAENNGKSPRSWLSKLEKLAKYNTKTQETEKSGSAILLGLWCLQHNNLADAKKFCYANVMDSLDMLASSHEEDCNCGYWSSLGDTLLKAGDRENGEDAYAVEFKDLIVFQNPQKEGTELSGNSEAKNNAEALNSQHTDLGIQEWKTDIEGPLRQSTTVETWSIKPVLKRRVSNFVDRFPNSPALLINSRWSCDGLCRRKITSWKELNICEICLFSRIFCEECIVLVRENKLPFKICGSNHIFFNVHPVAGGMGLTDDEKWGFGNRKPPQDLDEWLARVRREWDDSKPAPG